MSNKQKNKKTSPTPQRRPWKKHKQVMIDVGCGSRVEVDKGMSQLLVFMNRHDIRTTFSCEGRKRGSMYAYVSMIAQPHVRGLAHYLLENGAPIDIIIESNIHPDGYDNLVFRWPKKNHEDFCYLVRSYYSTPR